jgi:hypothetical protein
VAKSCLPLLDRRNNARSKSQFDTIKRAMICQERLTWRSSVIPLFIN